jgi:hypothetical protein
MLFNLDKNIKLYDHVYYEDDIKANKQNIMNNIIYIPQNI